MMKFFAHNASLNPFAICTCSRHHSLKSIFTGKKRAVHASATRSYGDDDTAAELTTPEGSDDSYSSRPKRRAVSMDVAHTACSMDKRSSLEQWHEARRARCAASWPLRAARLLDVRCVPLLFASTTRYATFVLDAN